ncbi:MAG: STAS domain-containing protein [Eubacterium sp.]|nr:STAS domain-containing protein [Eubacterium sp.]
MELEIKKELSGATLTVFLKGKLNSGTSSQLKTELEDLSGVSELIFDLKELGYIASAGFRVIIDAYKKVTGNNGTVKVINVNESNMEVFEYTGLTDILDISGI